MVGAPACLGGNSRNIRVGDSPRALHWLESSSDVRHTGRRVSHPLPPISPGVVEMGYRSRRKRQAAYRKITVASLYTWNISANPSQFRGGVGR